MTPARAAATIARPDLPTREESPITLTMRPFFPASRYDAAAWQLCIGPYSEASICACQSSGVVSTNLWRLARPALLMRMLSPPKSLTTVPLKARRSLASLIFAPLHSVSLRQSIAARAETERSVLTGDDHSCDAKV